MSSSALLVAASLGSLLVSSAPLSEAVLLSPSRSLARLPQLLQLAGAIDPQLSPTQLERRLELLGLPALQEAPLRALGVALEEPIAVATDDAGRTLVFELPFAKSGALAKAFSKLAGSWSGREGFSSFAGGRGRALDLGSGRPLAVLKSRGVLLVQVPPLPGLSLFRWPETPKAKGARTDWRSDPRYRLLARALEGRSGRGRLPSSSPAPDLSFAAPSEGSRPACRGLIWLAPGELRVSLELSLGLKEELILGELLGKEAGAVPALDLEGGEPVGDARLSLRGEGARALAETLGAPPTLSALLSGPTRAVLFDGGSAAIAFVSKRAFGSGELAELTEALRAKDASAAVDQLDGEGRSLVFRFGSPPAELAGASPEARTVPSLAPAEIDLRPSRLFRAWSRWEHRAPALSPKGARLLGLRLLLGPLLERLSQARFSVRPRASKVLVEATFATSEKP